MVSGRSVTSRIVTLATPMMQASSCTVPLSLRVQNAFDSSASEEPMTVVPTFRALGSAADLSEHLVGGHVLTGGPRRKWPVDQTALSLYRIARLRGGAFWHGVADHIDGTLRTFGASRHS